MNFKSILRSPLLQAALVLNLIAQTLSADTTGTLGLLTYSDDGTRITITDCDIGASGTLIIPDTINSHPVTSIGDQAFQDCQGLTSVTIPNSVTSIRYSAFAYCRGLTNVTIPSSVTNIGSFAFEYCSSLISLTISNNLPSIGNGVFYGCSSLLSVTIPNSVTSIGDFTFFGCNRLTSVTLPNSVTSIGNGAFHSSGLTSVTIPNSVTSIGDFAFEFCTSLTSVTIPDSVTSIGSYAFEYCLSLTSATFLGNAPIMGAGVFTSVGGGFKVHFDVSKSGFNAPTWNGHPSVGTGTGTNSPLTYTADGTSVTITDCDDSYSGNLVIPNSIYGQPVTSIGAQAFEDCSGLTRVTIPYSVTSIGGLAFAVCSSLISVTIPNSVISIGNGVFYGCSSLPSVTFPNSITNIGDGVFYGCSGLISVVIPNSVTSIGNSAFMFCSSLTNLTIPASVTSIGESAFTFCSSLTSITIPASVTSIGDSAFNNCYDLTSAIFLGNAPTMGTGVFTGVGSGFKVYYIDGKTGFEAIGYPTAYQGGEITIEQSVGTSFSDGGSTSFGSVLVGTSNSLTFTINNLGNMPLTGLTISKDGVNAADFTVTTNPAAPVAAGGITTLTVSFSPSSTGVRKATIHIASNDENENPFDISLSGTGITPNIVVQQPVNTAIADGTLKSYDSVLIGSSKSLIFTIKNTGTANLTGIAITKNGVNAADFTVTTAPATSVAPGGSTTFVLKFTPGATGGRSAAIHIANSDLTKNPYDITLIGTGITPSIVVQQPVNSGIADGGTKSFGNITLGSSKSLTFTIKNTGTANLTGIAITKDGANAADFKVTTAPTASVAPGESTTFVLEFTPGVTGIRSAAIHIANSDRTKNPYDITLTGTGTIPRIVVQQPVNSGVADGGTKSFGNVTIGSSKDLTFTIKNTGTANLTGIAITKKGANTADFKVTTAPAASVVPGGSTTFVVKFAPKTIGNRSVTIQIANSDRTKNPYKINLYGTASAIKDGSRDLTSGSRPTSPTTKPADKSKTMITVDAADGLKYLTLVVMKAPGTADQRRSVEVSSNLIDWQSGKNHTTVLRNDAKILKVRDNTPLTSGLKRYIRLK